jgi:hypothetical protein
MNLFVNGHDIIVTNEVHSIHLPLFFQTGRSTRRPSIEDLLVHPLHELFLRQVLRARRTGARLPKIVAKVWFAVFITYWETIRPILHRWATAYVFRRDPAPGRLG